MIPWAAAAALVVPNALTLARLALAAWFPWSPPEWRVEIVIAAALSDLFDGAFSRLFRSNSTLGQILDPVADKAFIASVLLTLLFEGPLQWWQVVLVSFRDLTVLAGGALAVALGGWATVKHLPPRWPGKVATGLQFLFVLVVLYDRRVPVPLLAATGAASVLAGIDYLRTPPPRPAETPPYPSPGDDATAQL